VRSAEVEEVLGQIEDPFETAANTHGILTNSELTFAMAHNEEGSERYEVTHGTLGALLTHADCTATDGVGELRRRPHRRPQHAGQRAGDWGQTDVFRPGHAATAPRWRQRSPRPTSRQPSFTT
jgi:hypothetical protein